MVNSCYLNWKTNTEFQSENKRNKRIKYPLILPNSSDMKILQTEKHKVLVEGMKIPVEQDVFSLRSSVSPAGWEGEEEEGQVSYGEWLFKKTKL